ncbi:Protein CBG01175 [Caenorhabditis briggsae]|uniref:Protein CBG01175 n=1 Tax=Caenorhabditis briggsae TaxID=6238 RepID=A8WPR7_CAEBR|nr:Protein CBG01175 [Caenorhabditis briggsae]CAP22474.2 Protein CBG01175 [Caenorhabditis briggsae]
MASISNSTVSLGIHGNPSFLNFEVSFLSVPVLLLFVPLFYIPATSVVVFRIAVKSIAATKVNNVNVQLFSAITLSHIMCLLFFFADFMYLRLPLSGLLTSWCASLQPSGFLVILVIIVYHINYIVVILPFLVAVIRLISILSPQRHHKIRNTLGLIFNTFFWLLACLIINIILIVKLVKLKHALGQHAKSQASHKAEISLTITSVAMAFAYVTNGMIALGGIIFPSYSVFLIVLRPFMNDLDTCLTPWIFYLTHPIFKKKSEVSIVVSTHRTHS